MLFFRKKLKKYDPEAEQTLKEQIENEGGLEKKDLPAMLISAFLVFMPVAILVLLFFGLLCILFFAI